MREVTAIPSAPSEVREQDFDRLATKDDLSFLGAGRRQDRKPGVFQGLGCRSTDHKVSLNHEDADAPAARPVRSAWGACIHYVAGEVGAPGLDPVRALVRSQTGSPARLSAASPVEMGRPIRLRSNADGPGSGGPRCSGAAHLAPQSSCPRPGGSPGHRSCRYSGAAAERDCSAARPCPRGS